MPVTPGSPEEAELFRKMNEAVGPLAAAQGKIILGKNHNTPEMTGMGTVVVAKQIGWSIPRRFRPDWNGGMPWESVVGWTVTVTTLGSAVLLVLYRENGVNLGLELNCHPGKAALLTRIAALHLAPNQIVWEGPHSGWAVPEGMQDV